jgi:hypothetical protein
MPRTSPRQRKTTGRVMHEFKHGELKSGPRGKGGRVKSRRQAVAIALKEAGASRSESKGGNRRNLAKAKHKEARGQTAQQRKEGKSHVGASGRKPRKTASRGRTTSRRAAATSRRPASRRTSTRRTRTARSR